MKYFGTLVLYVDDATLEADHFDPATCAAIVAGATDTFV